MANNVRLFFALWPEDAIRQSIVHHTKPLLTGVHHRIKPANLHITLAFVGSVEKTNLPCFIRAADSIQARHFKLQLDQSGCFSRARMLWLGCRSFPDKLNHLVDELNTKLEVCGYRADKRPFTPHVSLARKYHQSEPPEFNDKIVWKVNSFSLVESRSIDSGVEYHVLNSWALG